MLLSAADGLLERVGGEWRFVSACPEEELLEALCLPIAHPALREHPLFDAHDPWRTPDRLARLCGWLSGKRRGGEREGAVGARLSHVAATTRHDALLVHEEASSGRGIAVRGTCEQGEILIEEEAHSAALYPSYRETHCHFCLRSLPQPRRPSRCCARGCEGYCSRECEEAAWSYHRFECGKRYLGSSIPRMTLVCTRAMLVDASLTTASREGDAEGERRQFGDGIPVSQWLESHSESFDAMLASQLRLHAHVAHRVLLAGCGLDVGSEEAR